MQDARAMGGDDNADDRFDQGNCGSGGFADEGNGFDRIRVLPRKRQSEMDITSGEGRGGEYRAGHRPSAGTGGNRVARDRGELHAGLLKVSAQKGVGHASRRRNVEGICRGLKNRTSEWEGFIRSRVAPAKTSFARFTITTLATIWAARTQRHARMTRRPPAPPRPRPRAAPPVRRCGRGQR